MTVHNLTDASSFFHGAGVDVGDPRIADDGDTFLLGNDAQSLTLLGLSDTAVFAYGAGDSVYEAFPTGPTSIADNGSGLRLTVAESSSQSLRQMVSVVGAQNDPTFVLAVAMPGWPRAAPPTLTADGSGGTLVSGYVDLVGVAAPDLAGRVFSFRAYT